MSVCALSLVRLLPRTEAPGPEPRGSHYEMTKTTTGGPCSCHVNGRGRSAPRALTGGRFGLIHVCTFSWLTAGLLRRAEEENRQLVDQNAARDQCLRLAAQHDGSELSVAMALRPGMY